MTEPKFTDEDLKRLKEEVNSPARNWIEIQRVQALLARLEAAERIVDHVNRFCCMASYGIIWKDDYERWKKAVGK